MSWLGTALSYFTGGLTGAFNSYQQNQSINEQIAAQAAENQKNRDFSKQMYEQQWADYLQNYPELMKMENDAQFNLWKNQFATQSAYNSENSQVARSLVAGLNPSKNGLVQGSTMNMQPSTVQAPPHIQGSPLGGSISPTGIPDLLPANLLSQAAAFAKDISQVDINKKQLDKMTAEIDKMLSEKDLIDSQRSYQEMKNGVYQVFGYTRESKEILSIVNQAYTYEAQGDYYKAAEEMAHAQAELFDSEKALNEEKRPFVGKLMQSEIDRNRSEYRRNNAQAYEASMSGDLKKAQTVTEDINKDIRQLERNILAVDANPDVLKQKLNSMINDWEAKGWISAADGKEAEIRFSRLWDVQGKRESSWFREFDSATDWVKSKLSIFK